MRPITDVELDDVLQAEKYAEKREQYVERMAAEGFVIMVPENDELMLDIDAEEDFVFFGRAILRLIEEFPSVSFRVNFSKSGKPHRHVVVKMPFPLDAVQRIAFQAVLGSDRVREMLSLLRYHNGDPCPTLLAERTDTQ
jgi:hypothetical protein